MINQDIKQQIISHLQHVPTDTIWGVGIHLFVEHVQLKTDDQFIQLVKDLQSQMQDGPNNMKKVMGDSYAFFKYLSAEELSA